jgi:hypothetical protein
MKSQDTRPDWFKQIITYTVEGWYYLVEGFLWAIIIIISVTISPLALLGFVLKKIGIKRRIEGVLE